MSPISSTFLVGNAVGEKKNMENAISARNDLHFFRTYEWEYMNLMMRNTYAPKYCTSAMTFYAFLFFPLPQKNFSKNVEKGNKAMDRHIST